MDYGTYFNTSLINRESNPSSQLTCIYWMPSSNLISSRKIISTELTCEFGAKNYPLLELVMDSNSMTAALNVPDVAQLLDENITRGFNLLLLQART